MAVSGPPLAAPARDLQLPTDIRAHVDTQELLQHLAANAPVAAAAAEVATVMAAGTAGAATMPTPTTTCLATQAAYLATQATYLAMQRSPVLQEGRLGRARGATLMHS